MARAFLCSVYSYGSWHTSQKEYIQNPKLPIQMKSALFAQDVACAPLMFPIYVCKDLKIEHDNMHNLLINSKHNQHYVYQVPKKLLYLPWPIKYGSYSSIIHRKAGESIDIAQSSKSRI